MYTSTNRNFGCKSMANLARRLALVLLVAVAPVLAHATDLTVSAAASLTNAFRELGPLFEAANPDTKILFNFAASGPLLQQIAKGAPVDVFVSADQETMDQAQAQNFIAPATRRNFASNALVVIVPTGSVNVPRSVNDLAQTAYARIAIGLPASVPVGRYTKGLLEAAKLWIAIEPKTIGAESVRQVLDYVARGEVDAGFVYATDAAIMPDKVKVALHVPTTTPILYPAAVVAATAHATTGAKFVGFLNGPQAQAVLAKYGFGKP